MSRTVYAPEVASIDNACNKLFVILSVRLHT
jgi:hypothetical protein